MSDNESMTVEERADYWHERTMAAETKLSQVRRLIAEARKHHDEILSLRHIAKIVGE